MLKIKQIVLTNSHTLQLFMQNTKVDKIRGMKMRQQKNLYRFCVTLISSLEFTSSVLQIVVHHFTGKKQIDWSKFTKLCSVAQQNFNSGKSWKLHILPCVEFAGKSCHKLYCLDRF